MPMPGLIEPYDYYKMTDGVKRLDSIRNYSLNLLILKRQREALLIPRSQLMSSTLKVRLMSDDLPDNP